MRVTPCARCGTPIPATRYAYCTECRQTPAIAHRNGSRTGNNAITRRPGTFIGVDGEGYTRPDGTHHYTMLSVGDATLTDPNGDHLHFEQIFAFLWEQFEANPDASFVGFFLGYDFTHWFATLPQERAWRLLHKEGIATRKPNRRRNPTPFPVEHRGWEFDILNSVRFKLRRKGEKTWMYICDVGPYFQASFLSVIDPAQWTDPVCTPDEHATLVAGKDARSDVLTPAEWVAGYEETARYNRTENRILAAVMDRMKSGLVAEGIYLERDQWFGPGQAAQAWLDAKGAWTGEELRSVTPAAVQDAAQASYFGGWFEIFAHGHLPGETYEFDINSAYPFAMTRLPCLVHGAWTRRVRGKLTHPYTLMNVRVQGSHPIVGSMPCRRPDGTIARPWETEGWYWAHELEASKRAGFIDTIRHRGAWEYNPTGCPRDCPGTVLGDTWRLSTADGAAHLSRPGEARKPAARNAAATSTSSACGAGAKTPSSAKRHVSDPLTTTGPTAPSDVGGTSWGALPTSGKRQRQKMLDSIASGIPTAVASWPVTCPHLNPASTAGPTKGRGKSTTTSPSAAAGSTNSKTSSGHVDPATERNPLSPELSTGSVREIYEKRLAVGKNTPHGKALKITANSLYGKTAQSIGRPKYGNPFVASYITSWCRTMILDAIATHPDGADGLVMCATDGVYFRTPHPGLFCDPEKSLGSWESSIKHNLTLLKPGVYWDDKARAQLAEGKLPQLKSRGISSRDLAANLLRIDEEFRTPEFLAGEHWPYITLTRHFNHTSAKSAITRNAWDTAGQIGWQDGVPHQPMTRIEASTPITKRDPGSKPWTDHRGDLRLSPYQLTHLTGVSEPYSEKFGRMMEEDPRYTDPFDTPDGPTGFEDQLRSPDTNG